MQILAQHGFGNGQRVEQGLAKGLITGAIFGAKDIVPAKLRAALDAMANDYPQSQRLFDPQFYASLIAAKPGARLGSLLGDDSYPYFQARRRMDLERDQKVASDVESVLKFQVDLPVTALISPNIVIQRSFDSIEATISKNFLRNAATIKGELGDNRPIYATLAVSGAALHDRIELQNFLQEITEIENPPDGFYLLLERPDTQIPSALTEPDLLSRWMMVTHTLKVNGFEVIHGYTDALAPYFAAAGADAVASGWYNTLKTFSLKKFEPVSDFARRPVPRYLSKALMKSIRCTELHDLRERFSVMNDLPMDAAYDEEEGSTPDSLSEALQNWEGLNSLSNLVEPGNVGASISKLRQSLSEAEALYIAITKYGLTMRDRSSDAHIHMIGEELTAFEELAEI